MYSPVIIAGAGPAGLTLAAELRLAGVDTIVLDRLAEPTGQSRGLGFTGRTMEIFDQRGLLPRLPDIEISNEGHFGGLPIDFGILEGAHIGGKGIPQARTEEMLTEWCADLGTDIRREHELTGLSDDGDGVEVTVRSPAGEHQLRCSYLVGCDGGRSTVRKAAGFDFPGTAATLEMFIADVKGVDIRKRMIGEARPNGMVMAGPLGDGVMRIVVCEKGRPPQRRDAPPEYQEIAAGWQRLTGQDISMATPIWCTSFGDAARQVSEYRRGRVLLAGDAAHIHLPAGGQGMNTGIQDAMNLGWKLAATVRGWAPPGLLDTYHSERHPVAARLLMNTKAQGLLFLSGTEVQPLRDVMTELIAYPEVSRHLVAMVSGLEIKYDVAEGDHPLLGRRMPRQEMITESAKTSSTELLKCGHGVLLDFADDAGLRRLAADWDDRVDIVSGIPHAASEKSGLTGTTAVLIRPDGYVAWAAPGGGPAEAAFRRWFGDAHRG
ncbi:MAG TPA: FAD-dependent monooxygenase [Streptosporangiaceae bacterium]|nr:FAD-dependent monooxygenase [Streptosporangiaceae bacterium]